MKNLPHCLHAAFILASIGSKYLNVPCLCRDLLADIATELYVSGGRGSKGEGGSIHHFIKTWEASSRLYGNRFLQVHSHFAAVFKNLQDLHTFAHLQFLHSSKLKMFATFSFLANVLDFSQRTADVFLTSSLNVDELLGIHDLLKTVLKKLSNSCL